MIILLATMSPIEFIKQRTRQEWRDLVLGKIAALRLWTQENGELSLILGLIIGIIFVLFFKLIVFLFVFAILLAYVFWFFAPTERRGQ